MDGANCSNVTSATVGADHRQGWTWSPNSRGTFDIIWSCFLTLFLCCWSILIVNVPAPSSTLWQRLRQKLFLVGLCVLAPELIFQIALGQWLSARRSVALFHRHGFTDWTIRHGFYANMGGFHFQPSEWRSFPIDANQLHYLVVNHYIEYPRISATHIRDKNKADGMLRLIALIQTIWFVIDVVARAGQGLTVTTLELSTVAFVWLGIATSICWMSKPADVEYPDYLTSHVTMTQILLDGGSAASGPYRDTPLDFASRTEWPWSKLWAHGLRLLQRMHIAAPPAERPIPRIQNTVIPPVDGGYYALFVVTSITYFAIFVVGWKFSFPTQTECTLWRAASLTALLSALAVCTALQSCYSWYPALKKKLQRTQSYKNGQTLTEHGKNSRNASWFDSFTADLHNNSITKDPALDTPVILILATWFFGIFYCSSRAYIVISDFLELRSLPADAYKTVEWPWL